MKKIKNEYVYYWLVVCLSFGSSKVLHNIMITINKKGNILDHQFKHECLQGIMEYFSIQEDGCQ
jgi:hypothetical protein